jgi:hypothetical protein
MPIEFQNDTHWRDDDILRLVEEAAVIAEAVSYSHKVRVRFSTYMDSTVSRGTTNSPWQIEIYLPKRGPREDHPIPLVALASACLASDTPVLASQVTYGLANRLAYQMNYAKYGILLKQLVFVNRMSNMPPSWCPDLIIRKMADLTQDGSYKDFVKKCEKQIASADRAIEKWGAKRDAAQRRVDTATAKLDKARKSLADAKARRQT